VKAVVAKLLTNFFSQMSVLIAILEYIEDVGIPPPTEEYREKSVLELQERTRNTNS